MKRKSVLSVLTAMFIIGCFAAFNSCKKYEAEDVVIKNTENPPPTPGDLALRVGGAKFADGDTAYFQPGIPVIFYVENPTPGAYYTWDFCGNNYVGNVDTPQVNIIYTFPTEGECIITLTEMPAGTSITITGTITTYNPNYEPLLLESSSQGTNGAWAYNLAVYKERISDTVGSCFQVGEHTSWSLVYNATTTASDSLIHFTISTYNNMFKFNAGRGTTFASVTPSLYQAPGAPVDNTFQIYFYEGTINNSTFAPTIVSPGEIGDNAGPMRMTVNTNLNLYFEVKDFVSGLKTNPFFRYRLDNGSWSGNLPLTWYNGNGWTSAAPIPMSSIPDGTIVSVIFGADGGAANMSTSMFWSASAACMKFQVGSLDGATGEGGNGSGGKITLVN